MKKSSIDEQIENATKTVASWPQLVQEATEFKVSARYYNVQSCSDSVSDEQKAKKTPNKLALVNC